MPSRRQSRHTAPMYLAILCSPLYYCWRALLDPPPLRRPAAVVRDRRDVADRLDVDADRLQRANRRLAPCARSLDAHLDAAQAHRLGGVARRDRRLRRRERRPLARPLEADSARARPRHHRALGIGDGDDRVVERGLDVRVAVVHYPLLAALLEGLLLRRPPSRLFSALGRRRR